MSEEEKYFHEMSLSVPGSTIVSPREMSSSSDWNSCISGFGETFYSPLKTTRKSLHLEFYNEFTEKIKQLERKGIEEESIHSESDSNNNISKYQRENCCTSPASSNIF